MADLVRGSENLLFSPIVAGELLHGFRQGSRFDQNLAELLDFVTSEFVSIAPVTMETADRFARIAFALRRQGTPIPTNDIWIAAQALEAGADLVSFDRHFEAVGGLAWVRPA